MATSNNEERFVIYVSTKSGDNVEFEADTVMLLECPETVSFYLKGKIVGQLTIPNIAYWKKYRIDPTD
jgi:hypothetical protein